jgi:hypothetical protein
MELGESDRHTLMEPPFAELRLIYHELIALCNHDIHHFVARVRVIHCPIITKKARFRTLIHT